LLRGGINVGFQYVGGGLGGNGCVPIHNLIRVVWARQVEQCTPDEYIIGLLAARAMQPERVSTATCDRHVVGALGSTATMATRFNRPGEGVTWLDSIIVSARSGCAYC
jgi:hypothetical protein